MPVLEVVVIVAVLYGAVVLAAISICRAARIGDDRIRGGRHVTSWETWAALYGEVTTRPPEK